MLLILINARSLDHRVSIKTQFELAMTFTSIRLFKICKTAVCWERPQTVNLEIWVDAFFLIMVFLASLRDMTSYVSKKYLKSGLFFNFLRKLLRYAKRRFLQMDWFTWLKKKPQQQWRQRKENDLRNLGWTENVWLPYLCLWYPFVLPPHCIKDAKSNMIAVMFVCENDKSNGLKSQPHREPWRLLWLLLH